MSNFVFLNVSQNAQILPFSLPDYLATYFGNRLTKSLTSNTGAYDDPFIVYENTYLGKRVLKLLTQTDRFPKYEIQDHSFFIRLPLSSTANSIIRSNRYIYEFSEEGLVKLRSVLNQIFQDRLLNFVKGAEFAYNKVRQGDQIKRIRTQAIESFCASNNVIYNDKNLAAWQKMCSRYKKQDKTLIYSII